MSVVFLPSPTLNAPDTAWLVVVEISVETQGSVWKAWLSRVGMLVVSPKPPSSGMATELHRRGLRFRLQQSVAFDRRRRIDIVFPREKIAIVVDGCFWHSCPEHGTFPLANAEFWREKLAINVARDEDTNRRLIDAGWYVIRVWEHEDPEAAARRIEQAVLCRRRVNARMDRAPNDSADVS